MGCVGCVGGWGLGKGGLKVAVATRRSLQAAIVCWAGLQAAVVAEMNSAAAGTVRIMLGGNYMHNSKSFLGELYAIKQADELFRMQQQLALRAAERTGV